MCTAYTTAAAAVCAPVERRGRRERREWRLQTPLTARSERLHPPGGSPRAGAAEPKGMHSVLAISATVGKSSVATKRKESPRPGSSPFRRRFSERSSKHTLRMALPRMLRSSLALTSRTHSPRAAQDVVAPPAEASASSGLNPAISSRSPGSLPPWWSSPSMLFGSVGSRLHARSSVYTPEPTRPPLVQGYPPPAAAAEEDSEENSVGGNPASAGDRV